MVKGPETFCSLGDQGQLVKVHFIEKDVTAPHLRQLFGSLLKLSRECADPEYIYHYTKVLYSLHGISYNSCLLLNAIPTLNRIWVFISAILDFACPSDRI